MEITDQFVDLCKGLSIRRLPSSFAHLRIHYTANPLKRGDWSVRNSALYGGIDSPRWQREQEISYNAYTGQRLWPMLSKDHDVQYDVFDGNWAIYRSIDQGIRHPTVCFDDQTEILTENGWVYFKKLKKGIKVASINPTSKAIEFQMPTKYINEKYFGDMIKGSRSSKCGADFCVTPNHKMVLGNYKTDRWDFFDADDMPLSRYIPVGWNSVKWKKNGKMFSVPHKNVNRGDYCNKLKPVKRVDFALFVGFWLAEGCLVKGKNTIVKLGQKSFINETRVILNNLGWNYSEWKRKDGLIEFSIYSQDLYNWLKTETQWQPRKMKRIPREIFGWGSECIRALLDGFSLGDGRKDGSEALFTTVENLADDLQEAYSYLGKATSIHKNKTMRFGNPNASDYLYTVIAQKAQRATVGKLKLFRKQYGGRIYCVEVPNHMLVVRRNKRPMVCGNCLWVAVNKYGDRHVFREFFSVGRSIAENCRMIRGIDRDEKIAGSIIDPSTRKRNEVNLTPLISIYAENGIYAECADNSFAGYDRVGQMIMSTLARKRLRGEEVPQLDEFNLNDALLKQLAEVPALTFDLRFSNRTFTESSNLRWQESKGDLTQSRPKEKPVDVNDDGPDCVRYACQTVLTYVEPSKKDFSMAEFWKLKQENIALQESIIKSKVRAYA